MQNTEALNTADHSRHSSYREMLLEHLFVGEVMRYVWVSGGKHLEILKPQVDDAGYDLVLEFGSVVRHIQLKTTFKGSSVRRFNINAGLTTKPSGCVICILFDKKTLAIGSFLWFGAAPGKPIPDLDRYPIGKHTKGNAQGVKIERPALRVVPYSAFEEVPSIEQLVVKLFGAKSDAERSP